MRICSLPYNLTTSLGKSHNNQFGSFDFEKKQFSGAFSASFLRNIFLMKKNEKQEELFRYCKFIQTDEDGLLLKNGSYTLSSSMGAVVSGRADFDFAFRDLRRKPDQVDVSSLAHNEDIVVGHYVNEVSKPSCLINFEAFSIFAPSLWFFLGYASMFVVAFLFAYLLGQFLKKRRPWQFSVRLFYNLFSPENSAFSKCSAVGMLFVSVLLFLTFVKQMIGNNIQTEIVVVDTRQIIDSAESLRRTSKEACHPFNDDTLEVLGRHAKGTVPYMVFEKTNLQVPCFLNGWAMKPFEFAKLKKDFFIFNARSIMILLKLFNLFNKKDIFISPPFLTTPMVYFLSKRSKRMSWQIRKVFNHYVNIVFENGFAKKSLIDIQQVVDEDYPSFKSTFYSMTEYVDHYTHKIEAVTMDDFGIVYFFYIVWSAIFLVFCVHLLSKLIKRTARRLFRFLRFCIKFGFVHLRRILSFVRFRRMLRSLFRSPE